MDPTVNNKVPPKGSVGGGYKQGLPKGTTSPPTTCGSPIKGLQVFVDHCLICNNQTYLCPKDSSSQASRVTSTELRSSFYSLFDIPVPESFVKGCTGDEIPFCTGCTFKLGRLRVLWEQLEGIRKEFGRLKEEIAFSIVDVVAASGDGGGLGKMDLKSLPHLTLQRYLKQAEVDTLQRFVFDEWHDKSSSLEESVLPEKPVVVKPPGIQNVGRPKTSTPTAGSSGGRPPGVTSSSSGSMQPPPPVRKVISRPPLPGGGGGGLGNKLKSPGLGVLQRSPGAAKVNVPSGKEMMKPGGQKTTVISITTPETRLGRSGEGSVVGGDGVKRKAEVPSGVAKKLKSIPVVVGGVDLKGANEGGMKKGDRGGEGLSSSMMKTDEDSSPSSTNPLEISLDEGGEEQAEEDNWDPAELEITKVESGESGSGEMDKRSRENGRDEASGGEGSNSPVKMNEEIDFYEGMSLSELASFVTEEDSDQTESSEEVDPERQKYLENIIAQLQAGGSNIEFQQNEEGLYVCMFCSKTFIHKYPYRDHLKTHTGEGPRCPVCNKIFPKNHNLMLHLRTHTGEKPFQCDVCNKGFADKSNLKVHYRVHTGEKPYKCDFCNLAFVNSSRLVVHRRLHTGERPFVCDYCGKSFATPNQLQSHEKVHKAAGGSD